MPEQQAISHKLLLGTHTSGMEQNYLLVASVVIPNGSVKYETMRGIPNAQQSSTNAKQPKDKPVITVQEKIAHEGEVNRARYMPQKPRYIATKSPSEQVFVFDAQNTDMTKCNPLFILTGLTKEG